MTLAAPLPRLGDYELVRLLAQGGMADIYLAREPHLERYVALKTLRARHAADPEACALFLDEARVARMLSHPNLATVHEVGERHGARYLAMEYVHGADVREILARADGPLPYDCALTIVMHAALGLDHAHRRCGTDGRPLHLVHRDVSPSNIVVAHDGRVKVIDFGIATSAASLHTTHPGVVRGKASYMSPEQCLGDPVDRRSDVFALGVVLYEMTTGTRCFAGRTDFERMLAVVQGELVLPRDHVPSFPRELEVVICTALARDPADRFASAAALVEALAEVGARHGWALGAGATARLMRELFSDSTAPPRELFDVSAVDTDDDSTAVSPLPPDHDWRDDALTRGRRALPRFCGISVAA